MSRYIYINKCIYILTNVKEPDFLKIKNDYYISVTIFVLCLHSFYGGVRRGHDRMVVGFTTAYAISAYHH